MSHLYNDSYMHRRTLTLFWLLFLNDISFPQVTINYTSKICRAGFDIENMNCCYSCIYTAEVTTGSNNIYAYTLTFR